MTRLRAFLAGRWGFVLSLAALVLTGGGYWLRVQVLDQGLKVFDRKGDLVLVVSPADQQRINQRVVEAAWNGARRHPNLNDIRFIIYVDKKTVRDQFGRPPEMDVYLGNVFFPPGQVEALRQTPTLEEAHFRWPLVYLDWEWTYQRGLLHLAADPASAPAIPKGRDWAVSLNWVLFNMLPWAENGFRWTQGFGPGWAQDPHLDRADPGLRGIPRGPVGVCPEKPRGEMVFAFDFGKHWLMAQVRDIHTSWEPGEAVGLEASVDGRAWRRVYREQGFHRRNLSAFRLTPEMVGGGPGAESLFLRYTLELKTPSARSPQDTRGANLSFVDLAVEYAK